MNIIMYVIYNELDIPIGASMNLEETEAFILSSNESGHRYYFVRYDMDSTEKLIYDI